MAKEVAAAQIMILKPGAMTPKARADIAKWLRRHATNLVKLGDRYNSTGRFRGRYLVTAEDAK